jgi:hypothetical protein
VQTGIDVANKTKPGRKWLSLLPRHKSMMNMTRKTVRREIPVGVSCQ